MEITGQKPTDKRARALRFIELDTGCYVPVSHKLNSDGYFRKLWGNYRSEQTHEMFHRLIWRAHNGPIPDGHEIDHLCGVRCCCNPKHLACLEGSAHTIKGNRNRYSARKQAAKKFWQETLCSGAALMRHVGGITGSSACNWIKEWKAELQTISAQPTVGYST